MEKLDEGLDRRITEWLAAEAKSKEGRAPFAESDSFALDVNQILTHDAPPLSLSAQQRHLRMLRERAREKRKTRQFRLPTFQILSPRRLQVALIALIIVLLANGITNVSASSLPGSPLYPVKRAAEQSGVLFAPTAGGRARVWMNLASVRLEEVEHLLASEQRVETFSLDAVDQNMLLAFSEILGTQGEERAVLLQGIADLATREQDELDKLASQANPADRTRLEETIRLLDGVLVIARDANTVPTLLPTSVPVLAATPTQAPTQEPTLAPTQVPTHVTVPVIVLPATKATVQPRREATAQPIEQPQVTATSEPEKNKPDSKDGESAKAKKDAHNTPEPQKQEDAKHGSSEKDGSSGAGKNDSAKTQHRSHQDN